MMKTYLLTYNAGSYYRMAIAVYATRDLANSALEAIVEQTTAGLVIENELDLRLPGATQVMLYNSMAEQLGEGGEPAVSRFSTRDDGARRIFARIEWAARALPIIEAVIIEEERAPDAPADSALDPVTPAGEDDMATNGKKKSKKTNGNGTRGKGKPAGSVSMFKPVREGSTRQKILKLMDGTKTPDQIATKMECDRAKIMAHAFCLARDCGIGYTIDDGKLIALYPTNRSYEDAVTASKSSD
jgi:hypothetical protein